MPAPRPTRPCSCADAARRHRHGHESGAGRPPDPWQSVQFLGPALSHRALRPGSRDRADRLRRDGAYRAAHPAQDADRRFLRLRATGLGAHAPSPTRSARCSGWTWRTWPDWSLRACIPARCRTRTWSPAPRTRRCAAARRHHPGPGQDEDFCRKLDSAVFPGIQGGPLMHVIAAKAVAFRKRWRRPSRTTSARWWPTRAPWRP